MTTWTDLGYLFGTTFANKQALKKERNDKGQIRIVVVAVNDNVHAWEPIYATAPFDSESAYCEWLNSKVTLECAEQNPELAIAYLLHNFLYGDDIDSWDRRSHLFDAVVASRKERERRGNCRKEF
jgi:hypothetical protein